MDTEAEVITAESGTLALLNKSEIDMQIATAHKYPRSIKRFRDESMQMVTLSEKIAEECVYALPRKEKDRETGEWVVKTIEGPSARFAEVIASAWGNSRAGSRVVNDQGEFVTAQGVFHDLERNVAITYEVQRRITDSQGRRYKVDMIGVTANAACSIALRNAILKGVPKAFWSDIYDAARQTIMGTYATLNNRRSDALVAFQKRGVDAATIFRHFGVAGIEDITLEHLVTLRGLLTAIKEGDTTPEQAFAAEASDVQGAKPTVSMPKAKVPPAAAAGMSAPPPGAPVDGDTGEIGAAAPSPSPAASTSPTAAPAAASTNGALATEGERKMILNRCRSNNLEVAALMEQVGLTGLPADLAGLTKDGFIALKDALPKAA
jgi:hypothetical protein